MQQLSVGLIPVLRDNYIFLLQRQGQAVVVDPLCDGLEHENSGFQFL